MNRIFVVKEKEESDDDMPICFTGVMSNWGPVYSSFAPSKDAYLYITSFLRKEGNTIDDSSYESIIKSFLDYLSEIEFEKIREELKEDKGSNKEEGEIIKNRFEILDL